MKDPAVITGSIATLLFLVASLSLLWPKVSRKERLRKQGIIAPSAVAFDPPVRYTINITIPDSPPWTERSRIVALRKAFPEVTVLGARDLIQGAPSAMGGYTLREARRIIVRAGPSIAIGLINLTSECTSHGQASQA
jgi:hypothetical protein